eukprot:TRINITY_DN114627_c0_g1_i1.p1 TRINITY_DN114627_c0_g1~~TRINITY_DN114627_c0_g1_i1.p1  ORF type:complete len:389 (+),score=69.78 TRINITY_DN114627_c0_g1_i1:65-1231(+)
MLSSRAVACDTTVADFPPQRNATGSHAADRLTIANMYAGPLRTMANNPPNAVADLDPNLDRFGLASDCFSVMDVLGRHMESITQQLATLSDAVTRKADSGELEALRQHVRQMGGVRSHIQAELDSKATMRDVERFGRQLQTQLDRHEAILNQKSDTTKLDIIAREVDVAKSCANELSLTKAEASEVARLEKFANRCHDGLAQKAEADDVNQLRLDVHTIAASIGDKAATNALARLSRQQELQHDECVQDLQKLASRLRDVEAELVQKLDTSHHEALQSRHHDLEKGLLNAANAEKIEAWIQSVHDALNSKLDKGDVSEDIHRLYACYDAMAGFFVDRNRVSPPVIPPGRPRSSGGHRRRVAAAQAAANELWTSRGAEDSTASWDRSGP